MASVKVVLRKKLNKDNTYPLALRITKDRKTSFIHLGYNLKENEWNADEQRVKKNHPNSTRLNNFLLKKLAEATDTSLELETHKEEVSSHAVKQRIKPSGGTSFLSQSKLYLEQLQKCGKYNQYTADKPRIKHFEEYLQGRDIVFSDITVALLEGFKVYLKSTLTVGERTIVNHLVVIRSVFSQAIKANIVDRKFYPFGPGKIRIKFPESVKVGLDAEEVKNLESVELPIPDHNHARNLFLFSFYLAGMRVSDVFRLRYSDLQGERLQYLMGKNHKKLSLKLPEKALAIINQYTADARDSNDYIFPELKLLDEDATPFVIQRTIAFAASRIDKILRLHVAPKAKIEKKLTMHIARHTFGNISGDKIPIQMLQKLYRHSSVTTTIGYQANFIHKDADAALDAVINFSE